MAGHEVAVGHPHPVAPGEVRGCLVDVGIGRSDVGDRGEDHRVEPETVHPLLEVHPAGLLEAAQTPFEQRERRDVLDDPDLTGPGDVVGEVEVELAVAVRQRALRLREDRRPVDVGKTVQVGVAVGAQEGLPAPHRLLPDLLLEVTLREQTAGGDRRRTGAVTLVVGHDGEVGLDDLHPRSLEVGTCRVQERQDARARDDPLPRRPAETGPGAGCLVGPEVHPRDPEAQTTKGGPVARPERRVRAWPDARG